tara:strand:+ start:6569 stop:7162 length:594 start_codon:yes stop_codon:yes gene_type:complete
VLVGPPEAQKELLIHKSVIIARSDFFANALSGQWDNSKDNTIDLYKIDPNIRPVDFQRYLETVYTNNFTPSCPILLNLELCRAYAIAEAMLDRHTRNFLLQALYDTTQNPRADGSFYYPGSLCVQAIYEGTASAANPMRRLLVDIWHDVSSPEWYSGNEDITPKEFLLELVLKSLTRGQKKQSPLKYKLVEYIEKED